MITKNTITKNLKKTFFDIDNRTKLALERATVIAQSNITDITPVVTGRLRLSIQSGGENIKKIEKGFGKWVATLGTNVVYAPAVEKRRKFFSTGFRNAENVIRQVIISVLKK